MPLRNIVLVVIRLYAIQQLVYGIVLFISALSTSTNHLTTYLAPLTSLVFSLIIWYSASLISDLATKGCNSEVNISGLSLRDIYSFAFVFLGISFTLDAVGNIINKVHYMFILWDSISAMDEVSRRSVYDFWHYFIQMAAGIVAIIYARRFADKLVKMHK